MAELNLCNEVLENAIGVHRTLEKIEPLSPIDTVAVQAMEELLAYRAIGTVEEFKALKEKATPKKPFGGWEDWTCPTCGAYHSKHEKCCSECMQVILWT